MVLDIVWFLAGSFLIVATTLSAVRTVVIPHGGASRLTHLVFSVVTMLSSWADHLPIPFRQRRRFAQITVALGLLALPLTWLFLSVAGFTLLFRSLGSQTWRAAYELAGSSTFTLGFSRPDDLPSQTLAFLAGALAISILALLLVTYLPTIYAAYSERESRLTAFEAVAGEPPDVAAMMIRVHRLSGADRLDGMWDGWQEWFADLRETHTALPAVALMKSSREDRNWVETVGVLLDSAATSLAVLDRPPNPEAALCIRSGSLALRDIAEYFGVQVDEDPDPDAPISISRSAWDQAYDDLAEAGIPLVDRDRAWDGWKGWRLNYDQSLVGLGDITGSQTTRLVGDGDYGEEGIGE